MFYRQQVGAYQQANAALTARLEALGAELAQLRAGRRKNRRKRAL